MAKYCKQCGVKHSNNAFTCVSCGAPFPNGHNTPNLMKCLRIVIHSIIPVLAIVLLIIHFTGPIAAARNIMKALEQNDAEAIINYYPSFLWESDMIDKDAFINGTISNVERTSGKLFSFRISRVKSPSDSERDALMDSFRHYESHSFHEDDIKNIKIVWVTGSFTNNGAVNAMDIQLIMIKYDGHWCWWPYIALR